MNIFFQAHFLKKTHKIIYLTFIAANILFFPKWVSATSIYKYVDPNGQTRFSQTPPNQPNNYEVLESPNPKNFAQSHEQKTQKKYLNTPSSPYQKELKNLKQQRAKACKLARKNKEILLKILHVTAKNADGTTHALTLKERTKKLKVMEKEIKKYCTVSEENKNVLP